MIHPFIFNGPTDKAKGAWHGSYPFFYARILAALKNTQDSILEIGTDGGAPLLTYREWFNEAKKVVGIDVQPAPDCVRANKGVEHWQRDAYTKDVVEILSHPSYAPFAFICDDGSHFLNHQQFFVEHYPQLLSEEGIGCVEDIQDPSHIAILHAKLPPGFIGFTVDLRLADSRYDSLLYLFARA